MTIGIDRWERQLFWYPKSDDALWADWARDLPSFPPGWKEYGSGPHSIQSLRSAYKLLPQPVNMLEIGFNVGGSAAIWLGLGVDYLRSLDVHDALPTANAAAVLKARYSPYFRFSLRSDFKSDPGDFNCIFIDGAHDYRSISADIDLATSLDIKTMIFDDWYPQYGETQAAVENAGLKPIAIFGNVAVAVRMDSNWIHDLTL